MPVEALTYAALGARLTVSPEAARSLAKRRRLPRSLSDDGKALVSVDLAEIRHTPQQPREARAAEDREFFAGARAPADRLAVELLQATAETMAANEVTARLEALNAEIARLEASAADDRADFERERERADRLAVELLQATAETMAANEVTARLEEEVAALRAAGSVEDHGQAARRLGHLAASIVKADRKACG
jgi:DNA repair exonuclease SbcCD ATPase subunit